MHVQVLSISEHPFFVHEIDFSLWSSSEQQQQQGGKKKYGNDVDDSTTKLLLDRVQKQESEVYDFTERVKKANR
jgi:hypothetical protein